MATWHEITRDPEYQELSEQGKALVKQGFFEREISSDPEFKAFSPQTQKAVFDDFWQTPDDTGQGIVTSTLGSAIRGAGEIVPGTLQGVGALTGITPISDLGESARAGLEYVAPVNPIYEQGIPAKVANVAGNVASIIGTSGVGGLAGKVLGAERAAAAGSAAARQALTNQAIQAGAKSALYGTGFAQGAAAKAEENKRLGITGAEGYLNLLGGGVSELAPEMLPFGTALESAAARRLLGGVDDAAGRVIPGIRMSAAQEAAEGGSTQVLSNLSTQLTVPTGVEAPDLFEGAGEAALWEGVGGAMFGAINKLGRTPPEKQTDEQKAYAAELGAVPVDSTPPITPEESLKNFNQGGIPVVSPDGVVTTLPFNREDIRATDLPFNREDIRASELPFTREDIRPTQLPFNREDIRSTELPFSRQNIRGLSQLGQPAISPGLTAAVNTADSIVTTAENTSSDVSQATTAARNIIQGVVDTPQPQVAPTELPAVTPISDSPSPNLAPRAESSVEPRPAINGRDTSARDAWEAQFGVMRKGGRTHNDDGTPYQPTIFDEVAPQVIAARRGMTDEEATDAIGDWSETSIATSLKTLINAGWTWNAQERRMVPPLGSDPNESPLSAILRLQSGSKTPSPAMEQTENLSQTITDSNGEIAPEMSVLPPTVQAGAGVGEAIAEDGQLEPSTSIEDQKEALKDIIALKKGRGQDVAELESKLQSLGADTIPDFVEVNPETPLHPFTSEKPLLPIKVEVSDAGVRSIDSSVKQIEKLRKSLNGKLARASGANKFSIESDIYAADKALQELGRVGREIESYLKPITPQGTPTPATEGTVMPGGSAIERDVTKPEQMTPSERGSKITPQFNNWGTFKNKKAASDALSERIQGVPEKAWIRDIASKFGLSLDDLYAVTKVQLPNGKSTWGIGITPKHEIAVAAQAEQPVSSAAVDTYGIKLPQGYVKQGDLYIFSPQTTTVAAPTETAAPSAKEAAVASVVQQPVEGSIPTVEQESATTAIESTEKTDVADAAIQEVVDESTDLNPITDEMVDSSLSPVEKREAAIILGKRTWNDSKALFKQRMSDWMAGANETSKKLIKFFKSVASRARLLLAASIGLSMANSTSDANLAESNQFKAFRIPVSSVLNSKPARPKFGGLPDMNIGIPEQKIPLGAGGINLSARRKIDAKGKSIPADVVKTAQWALDTKDTEGYPFIVTDKVGAAMYFFDENGVLLKKSPVLVGKNVGDFIGNTDAGRITPSGRFEIAPETDATYGNVFSVMGTDMVDSETGDLVEVAIHRLALHDPSENRPQRIATKTPLDNRISWGCLNLDNKVMDWAVRNYPLGGVIYILPETAKGRSAFAPFSESNIESSKLLTKSSNVDRLNELNNKEDKKLQAAQKQREELGLKTLNSLIEKTRTNVVQGTVKSSDANQAVAILNKSGAIPNVLFTWIGTSKDFLADPANRARYPETWKAVSSNPNIEGMSENGQPIVFTDNVGVSDLDRNLAKLQGTTPEVAAVRRVILHENIHKGMFFLSLKDKMKLFQFLHRLYSPEELDQLAKSYDEYADWRINQVSYFSIIEEAMTRDFDSMAEIPRDGIWAEFMQFLRDIWQKITGKTSEPTLKNYKDVFRLIRNSLKNSEAANADRLKNGGKTKYETNDTSVRPYASEGYGSQRMEGVSTGDNSPRAQAIRKAVSESNWNELSPTQRAKALEEFGIQSIQSRYSFDAAILPVRVTNERTPKNRPASILSAGPSPAITIQFDTSGLADLLSGDAVTAFANVFDIAQEEVIHAAQHINIYNRWKTSKSTDSVGLYELKHYTSMINEVAKIAGDELRSGNPAVANIFTNAWNLYNPNNRAADVNDAIGKIKSAPEAAAFAMELSRMMLQMQRQDFTTETGWMRFVEAMKAMLEDITNALRTALAMAKNGQVGKRLQDEISEINALINDLESASQPMASKVTYDSPNEAAFNSGAEVARNADYDERDKAVRSTIRAAYDLAPKDNGPSVPLDQLFDIAKQSMPDLTENEFSQILQDLYEDSGALLQAGESPFIVTTPDGQRAGSAIIVSSLPTGAMASTIDPESDATKKFVKDIQGIESGTLKAAFGGRQFFDFEPVEYTVRSNKSYEQTAINYVNNFIAEGGTLEQMANSVIAPNFLAGIGIEDDVMARQALVAEVKNRVVNAGSKKKSKVEKKFFERLNQRISAFWQGVGSKGGRNQGQRAYIIGNPRYSWMFLTDEVDKELKQRRDNILNVQFGNDNATSFTQNSYENADMAKNISVDEIAQNSETTQEDIDLAFGETVLDGEQKTLWERTKDWIRELGIAMRHLAAMDSEAKKSVSDGQRNAITRMSRDEVIAFIDDRKKKISDALKQILGDEAGTNSPVDEMVKIAKKRASKGLTLDALESDSALTKMLREINQARRGAEVPLKNPIPWRKLLSQKAKTVEEYRQRIFDAISANEELKSATPEQKARLADLFAEAWESNRTRILDGMLERMIRAEEAKKNLSKEGAKALQAQRMRIVEDINLGIFDNDEIAKIMAEKFGIKSEFTDAEREKIESLIEILQDEKLNRVKRNKAAYELLETLSAQTDISIIKLLANFWVSSVLSGMNTVFSIGMSVFSGMGELTTTLYRIFVSAFSNPKQLPSEVAAAFKTLARVLSAVPRQANRAWQYLVTGDQAFLDPTMNDALKNMDYDSIGKNNQLAEQMAKSDKTLQKVMGLFMRTVSRLLNALDLFNSGLTKEGSLSIVFRQLNLDPAKIEMLEKKSDLKAYKAQVIRDDFNGIAPKTLYEKALVDSYALAEMMKALDELGNVSENADQMAMQGAMTLDPSGVGGYGYRLVKSMMKSAESVADKLVERNLRKWDEAQGASDKTEAGVKLALSYIFQFAAYNAANLVGVRFARFAGNKFNQSLSFLPIIGALRLYEAEFDADRIRGKEAFTDMIKRNQLTGVMAAAIGYVVLKAIAEEPDDEKRGAFINGGWSNLTPEKKQQKLASGQKEYTLGFGNTVINYGNWPGSGIIAAIGGLSDLIRFSPEQWSEKTVSNKLMSATASGVFSALEVPALSQFQELFGSSLSSKDPNEQKLTKFARVIGNYVGGFVPRILKDIDYAQDPNLRKYETLWEKIASHIPVYRRYEGKEYYDILGQQIQRNIYPGSREFMTKPTDPAYKVLGALHSRGIWLTPANAEHRMVGKGARRRSLTQEEADNYSLETGKGYKQMLLRYGQRALQMPTERAKAFLLDKADDVRDRALKKVYRGYTPAS